MDNTQNFNEMKRQMNKAKENKSALSFKIKTELNFAMRQNPLVKVILTENDDWFDEFNTETWANHPALEKLPIYYCFLYALVFNKNKYFEKVLAKTKNVNWADKKGNTILHHLCAWNMMFDCSTKHQGEFTLLKAKDQIRRHLKILLNAGADALCVNKRGLNAYDLAILSRDDQLLRVFHEAGLHERINQEVLNRRMRERTHG